MLSSDGPPPDLPPPEKPPRRRRRDARPAEIIAAGLAEFAEAGFAAARLDDIARRAGIAKGTIYRYFDSKEALFEAALLSRVGPFLGDLETTVDAYPGATMDLVRVIVDNIYDELMGSDLRILMRIIIAEGERFPRVVDFYYANIVAKGVALMRRIVERGVARGEFPALAAQVPEIVIAPAIMMAVWTMTFQRIRPMDREAFQRAHIAMLERYLLSPR